MPPRSLFVTDFDGTLVSFEDGSLPEANRAAIARATERGIAVAVATGRRRGSFRKDRHRLEGLSYRVSLSNGAVLLSEDNDTPSRIHEVPWRGALELARCGGPGVHGLVAIPAPSDGAADCFVLRPDGRLYAASSPWRPETHEERPMSEATSRPLVHAALHVVTRELAESLEAEALGIFSGDDVEVHSVRSPGGGGALLEVVIRGGKGRAVRDLAAELGIPMERTGAVGDDMNDARLLEAAAHRYAVGGSVLAARSPQATEVANAEQGAVADALQRFMLEME